MYDDDVKKPNTSYLLLGVLIAFVLYGMIDGENSVLLMILALPIAIAISLVSYVICSLLRPFLR